MSIHIFRAYSFNNLIPSIQLKEKKIPLCFNMRCLIGVCSQGPVQKAEFWVLLQNLYTSNWTKEIQPGSNPHTHTHRQSLSPRTCWPAVQQSPHFGCLWMFTGLFKVPGTLRQGTDVTEGTVPSLLGESFPSFC